MPKSRMVSLEFRNKAVVELDRIKAALGTESDLTVITEALELLVWARRRYAQGYKIIAKRGNKMFEVALHFQR